MVSIAGSSVKVKICGITNYEDARRSLEAGCDALGFVFYRKSPRYITPSKARDVIAQLPGQPVKIGVFVNAREETIRRIASRCGLDMLQFHGSETPEFCRRFPEYKVIKSFRVKGPIREEDVLRYDTFAYLFDTFSEKSAGGTGRHFDWRLIRHFGKMTRPIFLSGGLNEHNVRTAIKTVNPDWVDTCTSVESAPGKKDPVKVLRFVRAAKRGQAAKAARAG